MYSFAFLSRALHVAGAVLFMVSNSAGYAQEVSGAVPSVLEISSEGREVYETICQACHMADAKGGQGAGANIPSLANNPNLADKDFVIDIILHGRGGMPWLNEMLSYEQIAAVTAYVRSKFNNYPDKVTSDDVKRVGARKPAAKPSCNQC